MLQLNNLAVSYDQPVLNNVQLCAEPSTVHGIVGLNGSGKTTLLNAIAQRLKPDEGSILLNDAPLVPASVGFLETDNYFYPRITAREYVSVFMISNPSFDLEGWNQLFQLPLDALIDDFSTGMKKKTALLGLLCLQRPVLMLDEPFNGLDLQTAETLKLILERLAQQGNIVLVTSHILETLTSTCHTISYLQNGTIAQSWPRAEFDAMESAIFQQSREQQRGQIANLLGS